MGDINSIINSLKQVKGLGNFNVLGAEDKLCILALEEERNIGVLQSIKMNHTLLITHDSDFREPAGPILINNLFPSVPFPEVKAKSVVSSSPGIKVHNYLVNKFKLNLREEDATLLIGFDL